MHVHLLQIILALIFIPVLYFTVLEDRERGGDTDVSDTEGKKWQILIVVDGLAGHLSYKNPRVIFMPHSEGYHHLLQS